MRIQSTLILCLIFLTTLSFAKENYSVEKDYLNPNNPDRKAYIAKYKEIAKEEMLRSGIPASIKLAQGILESGDGKSELATKANNHFGMKCGKDWKGETYFLEDDDHDKNGNLIKSCFRVYEAPEESYKAHSEFLHNPKKVERYGFLFDLDIMDYRAWATGLKTAGYATNPRYATLLIGIIEANQLFKYDREVEYPIDLPEYILPPDPMANAYKVESPLLAKADDDKGEVVLNNQVKMIWAKKGDTPMSLAMKHGVKPDKLINYNDMYQAAKLNFEEGDKVYLQPKRKNWRGKAKYHIVQEGETMYGISQFYGIKLDKLFKKNRMSTFHEPAVGEHLVIRGKLKKFIKNSIKIKQPKGIEEPEEEPTNDELEDSNILEIISSEVEAFDLEAKADAYLKITKGGSGTDTTTPNTNSPNNPSGTNTPTIVLPPGTSTTTTTSQPTVTTPPVTQPNPSNLPNYHTVEPGETLYSIAKKYNVSLDYIMAKNNLESSIISIGQVLKLK